MQQSLRYRRVINGISQVIARASGLEVMAHFHGQKQALRLGPFFFGYADVIEYLEVSNDNFVHRIAQSTRGFCVFTLTASSKILVGLFKGRAAASSIVSHLNSTASS